MNKKDLKSGMTVKTREENIYLVVNDFLTRIDGFERLESYNENLTHIRDEDYDIVEVYQYDNPIHNDGSVRISRLLDVENQNMQLIWKRKDLPKLSSSERVILENLDKQYKWVARDKNGALYVYSTKPVKYSAIWENNGLTLALEAFPKLFTFVKWEDEQPHSIEELLKGE